MSSDQPKKRPSYGFFVYKKIHGNIQFLFLKKIRSGLWEPPKGRIEEGENEIDTAYREVHEESGLSKEHLEVFLDMKTVIQFLSSKGIQKTIVLWLACLKNNNTPVTLSAEHSSYKWANVNEACEMMLLCDDIKEGVRNCEQYIHERDILHRL